jgi:hypothetical protein
VGLAVGEVADAVAEGKQRTVYVASFLQQGLVAFLVVGSALLAAGQVDDHEVDVNWRNSHWVFGILYRVDVDLQQSMRSRRLLIEIVGPLSSHLVPPLDQQAQMLITLDLHLGAVRNIDLSILIFKNVKIVFSVLAFHHQILNIFIVNFKVTEVKFESFSEEFVNEVVSAKESKAFVF